MAQMRICFIGDSFVSGAFDDECLGWVGRICAAARRRKHDVSPYNLGVRGETSLQIARRWRAEAEARQSRAAGGPARLRIRRERCARGERQAANGGGAIARRRARNPLRRGCLEADADDRPTARRRRGAQRRASRSSRMRWPISARCSACPTSTRTPRSSPRRRSSRARRRSTARIRMRPGYAEWARVIDEWPAWRSWLP